MSDRVALLDQELSAFPRCTKRPPLYLVITITCFIVFVFFLLLIIGLISQKNQRKELAKACKLLNGMNKNSKFVWDSCIVLSNELVSWYQAKTKCTDLPNGHLVVVDSPTKSQQLRNISSKWRMSEIDFWVGLYQTDKSDEPAGNWYWSLTNDRKAKAGSEIPWWTGEPTQPNDWGGEEDCAMFVGYGHWKKHLADRDCDTEQTFICQYDL